MGRRVPGPPPGTERRYVPDIEFGERVIACQQGAYDYNRHQTCPACDGGEIPNPDYFSNLADPNPVTVWFNAPTEGQKRIIRRKATDQTVEVDPKGNVTSVNLRDSDDWAKRAIETCVVRVENYEAADGKPILTGEQLAELGESAFVFNIASEILSGLGLDDAEKKTSVESSGSMPSEIPASDGTAGTVVAEATTKLEIAPGTPRASNTSQSTGS